jgi:hypothetical protein
MPCLFKIPDVRLLQRCSPERRSQKRPLDIKQTLVLYSFTTEDSEPVEAAADAKRHEE